MSDVYIAVGFNNHALYYRIHSVEGQSIEAFVKKLESLCLEVIKASEHDYLSSITELQINSQYAAAFLSGRLQLHAVSDRRFSSALTSR